MIKIDLGVKMRQDVELYELQTGKKCGLYCDGMLRSTWHDL